MTFKLTATISIEDHQASCMSMEIRGCTVVSIITATRFSMRTKDMAYPKFGLRTKSFNLLDDGELYTLGNASNKDGCKNNAFQ